MLLCTTKYCSSTSLLGATPVLFRVRQRVSLQYYLVLQSINYSSTILHYKKCCSSSAIQVLRSTTKYYSSTTLYYKVLLQYCCVLQSAPTALYYSSATLHYKVLLQHCKVLLQHYSLPQTLTPGLLCGTKCRSSTTLYYKVLLLPSTTKCYSNGNKLLTTYGEWLRIWLLQYYSVVLLQ